MKTTNAIGLDVQKSTELAEKLNDLLSNLQVFYTNTRGYHWNIKGPKFFELHVKFEELYDDLILKIDEVAERILTLGATPKHSYNDYLKMSDVKDSKVVSDGTEAVKQILEAFKIMIAKERVILDLSGDLNDEGTNALMSDYIREQEKLVWMYSAYLG
jgi:starvation-inducible DNA-binding protein